MAIAPLNPNTEPVKALEVHEAMGNLVHEISVLKEVVTALSSRLDGVLRPSVDGDRVKACRKTFGAPLAVAIQDRVESIEDLSDRVADLLQRLEV